MIKKIVKIFLFIALFLFPFKVEAMTKQEMKNRLDDLKNNDPLVGDGKYFNTYYAKRTGGATAWLCVGFVNQLAEDLFGVTRYWASGEEYWKWVDLGPNGIWDLHVGDMIEYYNWPWGDRHAIFVLGTDGDKIIYADSNGMGDSKNRWYQETSRTYIISMGIRNIYHYQGNDIYDLNIEPTPEEDPEPEISFDINKDGNVDISDVKELMITVSTKTDFGEEEIKLLDVNLDELVDMSDVKVLLLQINE